MPSSPDAAPDEEAEAAPVSPPREIMMLQTSLQTNRARTSRAGCLAVQEVLLALALTLTPTLTLTLILTLTLTEPEP